MSSKTWLYPGEFVSDHFVCHKYVKYILEGKENKFQKDVKMVLIMSKNNNINTYICVAVNQY